MPEEVAIITSGYFPVPATMGGAVEALVENILKENEREKKAKFIVFSSYSEKAAKLASQFQETTFHFVKTPALIKLFDRCIYSIFKDVLRVDKPMSYRYILQRLYYLQVVARCLRDNSYSKLVLENHPTLFLALKRYNNGQKYRGRYFYHLHNLVANTYGCKEQIKRTQRILGVSHYINETLKKQIDDKGSGKYVVLKNKVDASRFAGQLTPEEKTKLKTKLKIPQSDVVVLFSGRLNAEKGILQLLEAWKKIQPLNASLLIVGGYYYGSGMKSEFEEKVYKLAEQMQDSVKFTGFIPYDQMPQILKLADIVTAPSIWDDPAPLTVIEALTAHKPLITTNSGGIPEYAAPDNSIVLQRDEHLVDGLADNLVQLITEPEQRGKLSVNAEADTKDWTISNYYADFCRLLGIDIRDVKTKGSS